MLEKQIEKAVCDHAKKAGLLVYKFSSPGHAAVPDRLFVLPTGDFFFIEFKAPGRKPTLPQKREHDKLAGHNVTVYVVDNVMSGMSIINSYVGGVTNGSLN